MNEIVRIINSHAKDDECWCKVNSRQWKPTIKFKRQEFMTAAARDWIWRECQPGKEFEKTWFYFIGKQKLNLKRAATRNVDWKDVNSRQWKPRVEF